MSLAVEALADEVYATHAALSRAGGTSTRHPFGEVVVNATFPDIQMVNCILDLQASDWSMARLEEAFAAALPQSRHVLLSTRDHQTYEELGPRLVQAGYRTEHQLIMVQLAEPSVAPNPGVELVRVENDSVWEDFNGLVRLGCAEAASSWPPAAVEQLLALKRWQAEHLPLEWYVAYEGREPVGRIGLYQFGFVGRLRNLFTLPNSRKRGVARTMMARMSERGRQKGCQCIGLLCTRDSTLPRFYEGQGFRDVGAMYTWLKDPGAALGELSPLTPRR